jgi:hypothetical protein
LTDNAAADGAADGVAGFAHAQILQRASGGSPADGAGDKLNDEIS